MNILRIILTFLVPVILGCTPLSPHPLSDVERPLVTRNGTKIVDAPIDQSQCTWWTKMHDPSLNKLMAQALENSNQLKTAQENVLQAQAKLQQARFAWLPTLNANANGFIGGGWNTSFTPEGALAQSHLFSKTGNIQFRGYYSGFVPSYSLNILANINNTKFAQASLDMQKAVYLSTRLSVISQVAGAYFMLLGQKEQLIEQKQLVHDLKELHRLETVRYRDGAGDLSTVTSLEQRVVDNEANLVSIQNSMSQVENAIQVLLNRHPGPLIHQGRIDALSVHGLIPANISSVVLKNRPDIIMALDNLKMSEATVGIAYANFFPTFSLTSLLGGASVDLSRVLTLSTGLWVAEAAASVPILNGSSYAQIRAAKAGYSATYYSYVQALKSAFADVDNSLTNQQRMNEIHDRKLKALQAAKGIYSLALARYNAGTKDYRDVINAKITVDQARLDLNSAKMQQLDAIVEVYQSLAGGVL